MPDLTPNTPVVVDAFPSGTTVYTLADVEVDDDLRLLIVAIHYDNDVGPRVISVTFDGVALDILLDNSNVSSFYSSLDIFYLKNPHVVTGDVVVTMSNTVWDLGIAAIVVPNVDLDTGTFRDTDFEVVFGGTESGLLTLTGAADDVLIDFIGLYSAPTATQIVPNGSQVELYDMVAALGQIGASYLISAGTSDAVGATWTDDAVYNHVAIRLKALGAVATKGLNSSLTPLSPLVFG